MTNSCGRYSEEQISRFIDGELSRQEIERVRQHLNSCAECRNLATRFREAGTIVDELIEPSDMAIDPDALYRRMQETAESPAGSRVGGVLRGLFHLFRPFRPLQAAAVSAAVLLLMIGGVALMNNKNTPDSPSAIVTSIDTEYTAVMIIETPGTHHTIIWYSDT